MQAENCKNSDTGDICAGAEEPGGAWSLYNKIVYLSCAIKNRPWFLTLLAFWGKFGLIALGAACVTSFLVGVQSLQSEDKNLLSLYLLLFVISATAFLIGVTLRFDWRLKEIWQKKGHIILALLAGLFATLASISFSYPLKPGFTSCIILFIVFAISFVLKAARYYNLQILSEKIEEKANFFLRQAKPFYTNNDRVEVAICLTRTLLKHSKGDIRILSTWFSPLMYRSLEVDLNRLGKDQREKVKILVRENPKDEALLERLPVEWRPLPKDFEGPISQNDFIVTNSGFRLEQSNVDEESGETKALFGFDIKDTRGYIKKLTASFDQTWDQVSNNEKLEAVSSGQQQYNFDSSNRDRGHYDHSSKSY